MAKDKNKSKRKRTTDDALKRIFGKDAAKRVRAAAGQLEAAQSQSKSRKKKR
jgi:hypothetical protein